LTQVVVPDGLDCPAGYTDEDWQAARIVARPPSILIDRKLLSEASRAALAKQRGITVAEAIELYFELLSLGYRAPFTDHQKRKKVSKPNAATTEERLDQNYLGKYRLARDFWPACFGDDPVDEISVDEVNDALELFWGVPANHGRSEKDRSRYGIIELIERDDAKDAQLKREIEAAEANGASAEQIDKMRLEKPRPRISVTTYINHGRVLANVGRMLMDMQLIDRNPFAICSWTNDEENEMKKREGGRKRQAWDDRIYKLWGSRIFRDPLEDVGDPMFWAPLIARLQGMRMEEILQLGPDDFGTDKGIPYLEIRHTIVNGVKTLSSARRLPVHPQLMELGLLKLVELRRKEGRIRLFPHLNRGKQKGTFSALFSKNFAYYRKTNDCYWPGLDFHALRTTFHHDLVGDDKSDAIRCRLMGHTRTDEGDRSYGQNLEIETLAERMKSVVIDISMIRNPFAEPSAVVNARAKDKGLRLVG
jgi:integrase